MSANDSLMVAMSYIASTNKLICNEDSYTIDDGDSILTVSDNGNETLMASLCRGGVTKSVLLSIKPDSDSYIKMFEYAIVKLGQLLGS